MSPVEQLIYSRLTRRCKNHASLKGRVTHTALCHVSTFRGLGPVQNKGDSPRAQQGVTLVCVAPLDRTEFSSFQH